MTEVEIIGELPPDGLDLIRRVEPVTVSVPMPQAALLSLDGLRLRSHDGTGLPIQARCLDRWSDGSARWVQVDFQAPVPHDTVRWTLGQLPGAAPPLRASVTAATQGRDTVVDTGAVRFVIGGDATCPFSEVTHHGRALIDPASTGLRVIDAAGQRWHVRSLTSDIEESGPLRAVVRLRGDLVGRASGRARLDLRLHFFAGLGAVRLELTLHNPRRARHPNGYWDLGDSGSLHLREVALHVGAMFTGTVRASRERGRPLEPVAGSFELRQESSGGEHWRSPVHVSADGRVHLGGPGYIGVDGEAGFSGRRATPVVTIASADDGIGLIVPRFWQHFPASLVADSTALSFGMFPTTAGPPHELQGGEQKTHVFYAVFGQDAASGDAVEWCRSPMRVRCASEAYAVAAATRHPAGVRHDRADDYERLIAPALDGPSSFFQKREAIDQFGWRHFGDLYGDHETAQAPDAALVSHYNNQYDAVQAFAEHFMRTGDWRWWELMDDLARHVVDIDIYHTTEDRTAYSGGLFWHTNHYTSAATASHRSYSRVSGLPGGGPSNEHNYTTGLLTHYFLTGARASADGAIGLARWVVAMDDGARSRFRLIDRGPTGLATSTYSPDFHGPGRGAGNSINALVDGHRLTQDDAFLEMADALVRRCAHPDDDPEALELGDAERRWSYTVFLQTVGKWLAYRRELGRQEEEVYAYGRSVLLSYARWMARCETPYLDRQDALEFPTETWAAQDLRKADVFHLASRYASPEERALFLQCRDAFFAYALDALANMPTATFTRPLVLLLGQGARVAFADAGVEPVAGDVQKFAPRTRFVPQKRRVLRRLRLAATVGLGGLLLLALLLV